MFFFFSSRRRHTRCALVTWSSDVCSSDLSAQLRRVAVILTYTSTGEGLRRGGSMSGVRPADDAVWIDLLEPTKEEERAVETALEIGIPSREAMQEIEASSRIYHQNGAHYMTASVMASGSYCGRARGWQFV